MATGEIFETGEYIERLLSETVDGPLRIATSHPAILEAVVSAAVERPPETGTHVECVSRESTIETLLDNFAVATQLSEVLKDGCLDLRVTAQAGDHTETLAQDATTLRALIPTTDDRLLCFETDDETVTTALDTDLTARWEAALPYSVDVPPYSQLLTLTGQCVGESVEADFEAVIEQMAALPADEQPRPVPVAVLLGAKHNLLLADVFEWMETTTLATQGTVSKFKLQLEEEGYIQTEAESNGVGRPPQRLRLGDSDGSALTPADVISMAMVSST